MFKQRKFEILSQNLMQKLLLALFIFIQPVTHPIVTEGQPHRCHREQEIVEIQETVKRLFFNCVSV